MGLRSYIAKRTAYTIVLLLFVITLNFIIFEVMPGSPIDALASTGKLHSTTVRDSVIAKFGLDKDVFTRFRDYVVNMLTFQFGYSYYTDAPVSIEIFARLSDTLLLIGVSTLLSIVVGVFLGVITASRRGGVFDSAAVTGSLVTFSLPTFFMGVTAILIFFYYLHWFPLAHDQPDNWTLSPPNTGTFSGIVEFIQGRAQHLFLPVMVLFLFQYGGYLLLTRATMTEALTDDYILTSRAKGLSERTVLFKHALKNASLPIVTSIALGIGFILAGALITESVFAYEGMGWWILRSINNNDYPAMQAIFYIIALMVIIANFAADIILGLIDPRIKYG